MQSLADDLISDMRTIEVAGVNVIDASGDGFAEHGERGFAILGRAKYARARELHSAVAEPLHGAVAKSKGTGLVDRGHDRSPSEGNSTKLRRCPWCDNPEQSAQVVRNGER
jgi:hypothetical protein